MKLIIGLLASILLLGCSNKSAITLGKDSHVANAIINLPRAIAAQKALPRCQNQHHKDRASCEAKKQKETDEMSEAMKKKN